MLRGGQLGLYLKNIMELSGYSQDDFISHKISYKEIIHPEDIKRVLADVEEKLGLKLKK